ncbi:hypothetical protein GXN76_09270 [Kroppenstedtia pulmonis]|uniref:Non-canonical purine NTP pyrophosphatase n=1 Tax=Kroppenstedtia pulmonis TaxID=1380685 RepID=A0A7D3XMX9_9BACL|nr:non-canonical purine NTP pyrophosphatase [Kroppenstedtia pulmonis]QKG84649.1 hypothetical protein GXN76_09270 [Kroppenstedtia pulmonis]
MTRIVIASHNPAKVKWLRELLTKAGLTGILPKTAGCSPLIVPENGQTPEENALAKGFVYYQKTKLPVLASDSGMEIDGLGGEPGVQVRRWNGYFSDEVEDEIWLDFFLKKTQHIPPEQRTGRFITAWAIILENGDSFTRRIVHPFRFAQRPLRPLKEGFPMDSITTSIRKGPSFQAEFDQWLTTVGFLKRKRDSE